MIIKRKSSGLRQFRDDKLMEHEEEILNESVDENKEGLNKSRIWETRLKSLVTVEKLWT